MRRWGYWRGCCPTLAIKDRLKLKEIVSYFAHIKNWFYQI
ncbi:MAG: hypothetical protein HW384_2319, partial [Dehalococcoidia bacterium]|nr:hypothetical protein [Dehalococcoidia bacterium]